MRKPPLARPLRWHFWLLAAICGLLASIWPLQATVALLMLLFMAPNFRRPACLFWLGLAFCAAFAYARHEFAAAEANRTAEPDWNGSRFCAKVNTCQWLPDGRLRLILAELRHAEAAPLPGLCMWTWARPNSRPLPGQTVCLTRPLKPAQGFGNDTTDLWQISLMARNIAWRVFSENAAGNPVITGRPAPGAALREKLRNGFIDLLRGQEHGPLSQGRAVLVALLFGDRGDLKSQTIRMFATASLAHSLALSGQHLAIAGLIGTFLILGAARIQPRLYLIKPRAVLILILAIPLGLAYLWLGNSPPSLLRAFTMLFFAAIWLARNKPFSGLDLLCAALAAILVVEPLAIFDISLQMSALCVAVICLAAPAIARFLPPRGPITHGWKGLIARNLFLIFATSLVIQAALLPLSLARFQLAGFWFPLNLFWLPLLGLIVLPSAAMALLVSLVPGGIAHACAKILARIAAAPCDLLLKVLEFLSAHGLLAEPALLLPHWSVMLAFALCVPALAWIFCANTTRQVRIRNALCAALILFSIGPLLRLYRIFFAPAAVEAIDVGQGQAILLDLPGQLRILIDGGGSYHDRFDPGRAIVAPLLSRNTAPRLAAVINTHPDLDHLGGLFHLIEHFRVGKIFENGRDAPKGSTEKWQNLRAAHHAITLAAGDEIIIGDKADNLILEVLHPPRGKAELTGNAASLILRLVKNGKGIALFTGDAEKESMKRVLAATVDISAELVVAPHHGSDRNLLAAFYEAAQPQTVVASCGYLNRWHYPGRKLRAWLDKAGIRLLDTGNYGRIRMTFRNWQNPAIKTWRELADRSTS